MSPQRSDDDDEPTEEQKLGHRRIDRQGEVSYKRVPTNALMGAIQLGIANSIGSLASKPERQLLVQDFDYIESVYFPSDGSLTTPKHNFGDFRFKTYSPMAFRHFRDLFNIKPADFLRSICTEPLKELSNPGASGSIFYVSSDDQFIIKTVQKKEAEFFQRLLSGYYMNIHQNPKTLLPKFFGFFCYQSFGKNIRLLVMNNLFPQSLTIHEKYDLKGSTYKRMASKAEREKLTPTLKDLDFLKDHKEGIVLDADAYDVLVKVLGRDTLVLRCFRIMDYSFLVGVHNIDLANDAGTGNTSEEEGIEQPGTSRAVDVRRKRSQRLKSKFSMWGSIQGKDGFSNNPSGGIPARNTKGENLLLFIGIIDILQSYRFTKKIEHIWKSVLHDGDTVSVHHPDFYAERFQNFIQSRVFRRFPELPRSPPRTRTTRRIVSAMEGDTQATRRNYRLDLNSTTVAHSAGPVNNARMRPYSESGRMGTHGQHPIFMHSRDVSSVFEEDRSNDSVSFCRKTKVPVIGVIENMSQYECPCCNHVAELFPSTTGGAIAMCQEMELKLLAQLPMDLKMAKSVDNGEDFAQSAGPVNNARIRPYSESDRMGRHGQHPIFTHSRDASSVFEEDRSTDSVL